MIKDFTYYMRSRTGEHDCVWDLRGFVDGDVVLWDLYIDGERVQTATIAIPKNKITRRYVINCFC